MTQPGPEPAPAPASALEEHDRQLARLLAEAEAASGPVAWPRVEAAITALVELYGAGLARILEHARACATGAAELDARLERDDLTSSLLVLHDLHPVALEARIARALESVKREVPGSAELALVAIDDGVARLAVARPNGAAPPTSHVVARAIEREAPELAGIRIEGARSTGGAKPDAGVIVPAERLLQRRA